MAFYLPKMGVTIAGAMALVGIGCSSPADTPVDASTPSADASLADGSGSTPSPDASEPDGTVSGADAGGDARVDAGGQDDSGDGGGAADGSPDDASDATDADVPDTAVATCDPTQCASGSCDADSGACTPPCSATNLCGAGLACCSGRCLDVTRDPRNCGACGNACSASQLCTGTACASATLDNLCVNAKALLVLDGIPDDDAAAAVLATGLAACPLPFALATALPDALDPSTQRPIAGVGTTCVAAGGPFGQPMIAYLDQGDMPVVPWGDATTYAFIDRAGADIVRMPAASVTTGHDYFLVAMTTEPQSGTAIVASYGFLANGTRAAAWYFANVLVPSRATRTKRWYVYEWTDIDGLEMPDEGDTFTEVQSGM